MNRQEKAILITTILLTLLLF